MKYLAILKDSLREALDSKVLYVLFGLTLFVTLLVATLAFKLLSAEKTYGQFLPTKQSHVPIMVAVLGHYKIKTASMTAITKLIGPRMSYRLDKVELLRGEEDAPESDYTLTISRLTADEAPRAAMIEKCSREIQDIFADAAALELLSIGTVEALPVEGGRAHFRLVVYGNSRTRHIWAAEPSILFGTWRLESLAAPLGFQIYFLGQKVIAFGSWVGILAGVIITSFFIPNMLKKGTIDMLLVKPIHRWALLLYKYVGGLSFMLMSTTLAVGAIWLVLGVRTGIWGNATLLLIPILTFFFAILYAISTFVGVITRSIIAAIILTISAWFGMFAVGFTNAIFDLRKSQEDLQEKFGDPVPEEQIAGGMANWLATFMPSTGACRGPRSWTTWTI